MPEEKENFKIYILKLNLYIFSILVSFLQYLLKENNLQNKLSHTVNIYYTFNF